MKSVIEAVADLSAGPETAVAAISADTAVIAD